jgi:serine phosphatase RsbU (regulator of sigma subunit)
VIELRAVALLLFAFAMAVLLNQRAARLAAEQGRLKQELAAARQVQALLLTSASKEIPGFAVETAYLPASEVGGDFFYLRALEDGGLLVVVGDVSGKGLKAAMLVSLLIGALRSEERSEPAVVLGTLNRSLTDQVQGGFVTACCARVECSGRLSLANAGHIAPWIDGVEASVEPSLPLGLDPDLDVANSTLRLEPNQTIVLVSDGVIEAANRQGELLGFERAGEWATKPARELADAAKAWGQNDDITVVAIRRLE